MTDNLPTKVNEYHVPIIICPNCGEKDRIGLTEINREVDNNLQELWHDPHGPPSLYSNRITESCEIAGLCGACGTSFNFKITADIPRNKFLP